MAAHAPRCRRRRCRRCPRRKVALSVRSDAGIQVYGRLTFRRVASHKFSPSIPPSSAAGGYPAFSFRFVDTDRRRSARRRDATRGEASTSEHLLHCRQLSARSVRHRQLRGSAVVCSRQEVTGRQLTELMNSLPPYLHNSSLLSRTTPPPAGNISVPPGVRVRAFVICDCSGGRKIRAPQFPYKLQTFIHQRPAS